MLGFKFVGIEFVGLSHGGDAAHLVQGVQVFLGAAGLGGFTRTHRRRVQQTRGETSQGVGTFVAIQGAPLGKSRHLVGDDLQHSLPQLDDSGIHQLGPQFAQHGLHAPGHELRGVFGVAVPMGGDVALYVGKVNRGDVRQLGHFGSNVAGEGQVNHGNGTRAGQHVTGDGVAAGTATRHDDVGMVQGVGKVADRDQLMGLGEGLAPARGGVDAQLACTPGARRTDHRSGKGSRTDDQDPLRGPVERAKHVQPLGHHRAASCVQRGFPGDASRRSQRFFDDHGEGGAGLLVVLGVVESPAHLAGDLPFAHHHGFQPGGHAEQVRQRFPALQDVPGNGVGSETGEAKSGVGGGEVGSVDQQLDAIARRQQHDAVHVTSAAQFSGDPGGSFGCSGDLCEALAVVLEREDSEVHDQPSVARFFG